MRQTDGWSLVKVRTNLFEGHHNVGFEVEFGGLKGVADVPRLRKMAVFVLTLEKTRELHPRHRLGPELGRLISRGASAAHVMGRARIANRGVKHPFNDRGNVPKILCTLYAPEKRSGPISSSQRWGELANTP